MLNVATRGVLTHLENTKSHFRPERATWDRARCWRRRVARHRGPGPRWGSSRRSPRPPSRLGRGIPPPHSPPVRRLQCLDASQLDAFSISLDPMWPSTSIECPPPNEFCWRRACL